MAYQDPRRPYQQLRPTFTPGYHYKDQYHNIGQLRTPYIGKWFGQEGDYAPPQRTRYYTPQNPTYPYPLDKDFNAGQFIPTNGCCYGKLGYSPCGGGNYYPDLPFIPPDYFAPHTRYPRGHQPARPRFDVFTNEVDVQPGGDYIHPYFTLPKDRRSPLRENYGGPTGQSNTSPEYVDVYKKLPVAHPGLKHATDFFPFDNYY